VDTPSAVSIFFVPSSAAGAEEEGTTDETKQSVVVWVNDGPLGGSETTP
jgi:hypothetical protein